jgi:hypothetical protein
VSVVGVTEISADISAEVDPGGVDTHVYVAYGEGKFTAPTDIGAGSGLETVSLSVEHLRPGTNYHFRVLAFNAEGSAEGQTASFLTSAPGQPAWLASASVYPTYLPPGGEGDIQIDLENVGAVSSSGAITVTDTLPPGVSATKAGGMVEASSQVFSHSEEEEDREAARWTCTGNGSGEGNISGATVVSCLSDPAVLEHVPGAEANELVERVGIDVMVDGGASSGLNHVTVEGGGASRATSSSDPVTVSSSQPGFGFSGWDVLFSNADGSIDAQADSHPSNFQGCHRPHRPAILLTAGSGNCRQGLVNEWVRDPRLPDFHRRRRRRPLLRREHP